MNLNLPHSSKNKPLEQASCLCLPFVTLAHFAQRALSAIAEFFRNLLYSTCHLNPNRIHSTPPVTQTPEPSTKLKESTPPIPTPPVTQTLEPSTKLKELNSPTSTPPRQIARPPVGQRCLPSDFIDFYKGAINDQGITLAFLLEEADDAYLENKHFWVQWAFPTTAPGVNSSAPLLDQETIGHFRSDPDLQKQLVKIFKRVLCFFGLKLQEETGVIVKGENFAARAPASWLKPNDHNHLRITRILTSLQLLQTPTAPSLSISFFRCLKEIQKENKGCIQNFSYWQEIHPTL